VRDDKKYGVAEEAVATSGPGNRWLFSERNIGGDAPARRVLRFGSKVLSADVPSIPERYRGLEGPSGRLDAVRLHPSTGEVWLRLRPSDMRQPLRRLIRMYPLNRAQSPTPAPAPEILELRGGMRVSCHDGYLGRLEGIAIDARAGLATDLLVHIRSDVRATIDILTDPFAFLLPVNGQRLLLSAAWAESTKSDTGRRWFRGGGMILNLNASAEQVASATRLRGDGDIAGDVIRIFDENPALAPYTARIRVSVRDGEVTLLGAVPSRRHRASAEQDAWHVSGVFAVRNELTAEG